MKLYRRSRTLCVSQSVLLYSHGRRKMFPTTRSVHLTPTEATLTTTTTRVTVPRNSRSPAGNVPGESLRWHLDTPFPMRSPFISQVMKTVYNVPKPPQRPQHSHGTPEASLRLSLGGANEHTSRLKSRARREGLPPGLQGQGQRASGHSSPPTRTPSAGLHAATLTSGVYRANPGRRPHRARSTLQSEMLGGRGGRPSWYSPRPLLDL